MIALLPLLLLVACKEPSPLDEFVENMEDPEWCPTSWENGVYQSFWEAECRQTTGCGDSIFDNCMAGLETSSIPTCIRGCDVRDCMEWRLSGDCEYSNRPDTCLSAYWCD